MSVQCAIWGTDATYQHVGDALQYDLPRAGGKYLITGTAVAMLQKLDQPARAKLTTWLVDQRRSGNECPEITSSTLTLVKSLAPLKVEFRCDRFLLCAEGLVNGISGNIRIGGLLDKTTIGTRQRLAAWTECLDESKEVAALARFLAEEGLVNLDDINSNARITLKGWRRIEGIRLRIVPSVQGFVAMWFDSSMEPAYREGFEPAIRESGYTPMRIDRKEHINKIDDEIIAEIRRSRFVVADFTSDRDKPRGGVYFEAGFAMGLNIPVFWTCRAALIDQVHFDTRQFNHITWDDPVALKKALRNRIEAVLGRGPTS